MSFDDPRQFTNQMAYQSYFSPPGFSFESPFGYPNMDMSMGNNGSAHGNGNGNAQAGPSSMPMGMNMAQSMPMSMSLSNNGRPTGDMNYTGNGSSGSGSESGTGGVLGQGTTMNGATWMIQPTGDCDKAKYDMFSAPSVNLPTGDRFSQLLERKLGMDMQSTPSFPSLDSSQQPGMAFNAFTPNRPFHPPSADNYQNQAWDRLAVEANLQDYRQVHIAPDLVAPALPANFFPYNSQTMPYDTKTQPQPQPQAQEYRAGTPFSACNGVSEHQRYMPYMSYQGGFDSSLTTSTFPQASPLPTSTRSSPSTNSHQLITPQSATHPIVPDLSWSTQYMNVQPQIQGVQYSHSVPPPSTRPQANPSPAGQSIYTGYQPTQQSSGRSHDSANPASQATASERSRLAALSGSMGAMPMGHSQSLPGPGSEAVNMNGMWSRETHPSSSYSSGSGSTTQVLPAQMSRSPAQMKRSPMDGLPTSLPSAPVISKRSRSPHHNSQGSSSSNGRSPASSSTATDSKPKRPKLSISHAMPLDQHDHEDEHDEDEKKVVIACHTCRARKLKCDGARPKCFHCSRRNEDGCSYDVVLRRRGPGRKNKSKKSSERSESSGAQ